MDFDRIHIKSSSDLQTFHPTNLSRNLILELESNSADVQRDRFSTSPMQNLFIWIAILGIISYILFEIIRELGTIQIGNGVLFSFTPIKCRSCQFYARNLYLKCAVHPSIVLTRHANDCLDYCSNSNLDSHSRLSSKNNNPQTGDR